MKAVLVFFCLLALLSLGQTLTQDKKVLVLLDDPQIRNSHSIFFRQLENSGHNLHFAEATDPELQLSKYGEYLYDSLVIFAPHTDEFGGSITVDSILNFIDDGHSVLLTGDTQVSEPVRELGLECGVEFADDDNLVIDHLNFDVSDVDGDHTLIVSEDVLDVPIVTGEVKAPVLFRGTGLSLEEGNTLLLPVLTGASTAYVYAPEKTIKEEPQLKGKKTVLVAALQARNNARVVVSGSLEFFSDKFFKSSVEKYSVEGGSKKYDISGNEQLSRNLILWALGQRGVLRASNVSHHRPSESEVPRVYTVKEDLEYSVDIEEWDGTAWKAYEGKDVQLEFVMLDPYVRVILKKDEASPKTFKTTFMIPDVYGVYTLRLVYQRRGYTFLADDQRVTVRPLRHNQYERFILSAYPYYASAFSMMVGLVLFSLFFLFHKDTTQAK